MIKLGNVAAFSGFLFYYFDITIGYIVLVGLISLVLSNTKRLSIFLSFFHFLIEFLSNLSVQIYLVRSDRVLYNIDILYKNFDISLILCTHGFLMTNFDYFPEENWFEKYVLLHVAVK